MSNGTVHLIDDDKGVRESLGMLLETEGLTTRTYGSAEEFLEITNLGDPGCVVADVRMPGMDGIDLLRHLNQRAAEMPVIIITGHAHVALAVQALKAGAADFFEKPFGDTAFLNAVREAMNRGEAAFRERERVKDIRARLETLTPREREVMDLIVQGMSNKTAAMELDISVRTIEIHRARVMDKMAAGNLSALVRMAMALEDGG